MASLLSPSALGAILRSYGAVGLSRRALHEFRRTLGSYRRAPKHPVRPDEAGRDRSAFRVDAAAVRVATDLDAAVARAERVVAGEYQAFRHGWLHLPEGDQWHRHPHTGAVRIPDRDWWRRNLLDPAFGDIKDLWEPARFGWVYDLLRGYAVTGDPRFRSAFVGRVTDWWASNPPFSGPHWACGQETAIRAIALLYAEANFDLEQGERQLVLRILGASGERIRDAIGYALSQRNNHGLSESAGLVAIGDRLSGLHPAADRWYSTGRRLVTRLVREQFAEDGWYCQHSFVYLRLAVDQCVIASRVFRSRGDDLDETVSARLRSAQDLLMAVLDPETGVVPNYGPSDGAFVHPITLGAYRDFRPTVTALAAVVEAPLPEEVAPDREVLAWLGRTVPGTVKLDRRPRIIVGSSGWASARLGNVAVFLRAGRYRFRPGHFDPLQLDVRIGSSEVLTDPGTYRYGGAPPWRNRLVGSELHNGPTLLDKPSVAKGPRFLWLQWPAADIVSVSENETTCSIVAVTEDGLEREVRVSHESVEVRDRSRHGAGIRVNWLLHPEADARWISASDGRWTIADDASGSGWFSPAYGVRVPSRYFVSERRDGGPLVLRVHGEGVSE